MPTAALRALLAQLIDYAGLFPPASLAMPEAAAQYAEYRRSPDAWALGRIVVPVARLDDLSVVAAQFITPADESWRVSALVGEDAESDANAIGRWNVAQRGRLIADTVEVRASDVESVAAVAEALGRSMTVYVEIPVAEDPGALVDAIADVGVRAKIRTGGLTSAAFPTPSQVARFIVRCAERGVPFKATAGLHHPLRGEYRLSYAPDAERGTMFGFLNAFLAASFARARSPLREADLAELLVERERDAVVFGNDGVSWRGHDLSTQDLLEARATFAVAFGSCSFREPIDDLLQFGLL
jgi:hypothetical protein